MLHGKRAAGFIEACDECQAEKLKWLLGSWHSAKIAAFLNRDERGILRRAKARLASGDGLAAEIGVITIIASVRERWPAFDALYREQNR